MGEEVFPTECPCGRTHPAKGKKAIKPSLEASRSLPGKLHKAVADAVFDGKGDRLSNGIWELSLERNCERPVRILRHSFGEPYTQVAYNVRCRACGPCLNARRAFWALSAMAHHQRAVDAGLRTWFGSLTLTPARQQQLLERALYLDAENPYPSLPNWDDVLCHARFAALRDVLIADVQRYWKRLRSKGHAFKYFLVVEQHLGGGAHHGLPHVHFLLHEEGKRILKRELEADWPFGNTDFSLVAGRSKRAAGPRKAAWYVAKYLSKSSLTRQIASIGYTRIIRRGASPELSTSSRHRNPEPVP